MSTLFLSRKSLHVHFIILSDVTLGQLIKHLTSWQLWSIEIPCTEKLADGLVI